MQAVPLPLVSQKGAYGFLMESLLAHLEMEDVCSK